MEKVTRGIRNNNPANIRKGFSNWKGLATCRLRYVDDSLLIGGSLIPIDKQFCQFVNIEYGVRALIITLRTYQLKHSCYTIEKIINRFAPVSDGNATLSYIAQVTHIINDSMGIGLSSKDSLSLKWSCFSEWSKDSFDYDFLYSLCFAICKIESHYFLTEEVFESAIHLV